MFSAKKIKTPDRGLLAMHPFVDALEGRSLFTATAHDGLLEVAQVQQVGPGTTYQSPWSEHAIAPAADALPCPVTTLARLNAPARIEIQSAPSATTFSEGNCIGDGQQTLFENVNWDRRKAWEPAPLPTQEMLDAARAARRDSLADLTTGASGDAFCDRRAFTGAMRPYLTVRAPQVAHLFAA